MQRREPSIPSKLLAAEQYARRQLGSIAHERCVAAVADDLFVITSAFHRLTTKHRRLLQMAALLHDVGRRYDDKNHPARGAEMIDRARGLPLTARQRRSLCYCTRYHRGAVPKTGFDGILRNNDSRRELRLVLALLRTADALDNRQLESSRIYLKRQGRRLTITCTVGSDDFRRAQKAIGRRKKVRLLEELLDLSIEIDVRSASSATKQIAAKLNR